ncbi:MAG: glycosyltransferase family 4 protein [Alphaproteobacteria bacterium]|nr:glycosyltransferase family 4 protein [Alphaproteobacteria bacterium]
MSGRPPRLLFLMNDAPFYVSHRLPIGVAARAAGFEVHVAAPADAAAERVIAAAGLRFHPIPLARGGRSPLGEARLILAILALVRRIAPDVMHAVTQKPVCYGGIAAHLCRVPASVFAVTGLGYLFVTAGAAVGLMRRIALALYRLALARRPMRAIFQNPDDRALFVERGLVDPALIRMIEGCGVDMARFAPAPEAEGPVTAMFPARLVGDKGVREFVEAARILRAGGSEARFVLVGRTDPENPTDIPAAERQSWIESGLVEWWGFAEDMPAALAQAHVVCLPSYREGLPRGLIEAAAMGLPVVATDVPGCREVVRASETGLLVPARDAKATAEALGRLIADRDLRRRMGAAGRAMAVAKYAVEDFVARSLAVYREVMDEAGVAWPRAMS